MPTIKNYLRRKSGAQNALLDLESLTHGQFSQFARTRAAGRTATRENMYESAALIRILAPRQPRSILALGSPPSAS